MDNNLKNKIQKGLDRKGLQGVWEDAQKELLNEMIREYESIEINVSDWLNERKRKLSDN